MHASHEKQPRTQPPPLGGTLPLEAAPTGRAAGAWPEHPLLSLNLPQCLFSTFPGFSEAASDEAGLCFWFVATGPKVFLLKENVQSKDLKIASCTLKGSFEFVGSGDAACAGPDKAAYLCDT